MMMNVLLSLFYFLFVTLLFHPLFVTFGGITLLFVILSRLSWRMARSVDAVDPLWLKSLPSSDNIRLVWCDPQLETECVTENVLRTIDPALVRVTDVSLCEMTVQKLHRDECKTIFLVLSGTVADELLTRVTPDVHTIFIFCFDQTKYLDLKTRPKIDIISDSPSILIERIQFCLSSIKRRYATEHEQQSLRNLSKETATFIWFHVLRHVIFHFRKSPEAKNEMIAHFNEYYHGNVAQLEKWLAFDDTYDPEHVLWWYTRPSFISDIINKTIRARDIDGLFSLRYFIVDLCQQLAKLPRPTEQFITHRAVLMDRDKFEKMKETMHKGDLVSTRGFLSTSLKRETAEHFGSNDNNDPNKVEIMYEIDVPLGLQHIICADINQYSQFVEEEEILFDLDSSFEFIELVRDAKKEDRWIIRLQASDRGALLAAKYVADSNRELGGLSAEILFGKLLIDMGDPEEAISYFQRLLNQSNEHEKDALPILSRIDRGVAMNHIGHAWYRKGDYQRALQWFDLALALQQQEPPHTYNVAATMNNKGVLLMMAGKWQPAFMAFEHAADIMTEFESYEHLAAALGNMGAIKDQIGEYETALKLYQQAGEALKAAGIHDDHPDVAENELKIAFVYINQARWTDALNKLEKVKEIRECILPASHADLGRTWFTIGIVLRSQQRYKEAFEHMTRALAIYKHSYGFGHAHIANVYNSLANLKCVQNEYDEALPLYEQAQEQFRQFYGTDEHSDIARVLNNMGQAHRHLGHLSEALTYLEKALHMRQNTLGFDHPDTATTWVNLSLAHQARGNLNIALDYAQRGLHIRRTKLQPEHEDLVETENFVVQLEQEILALNQQ